MRINSHFPAWFADRTYDITFFGISRKLLVESSSELRHFYLFRVQRRIYRTLSCTKKSKQFFFPENVSRNKKYFPTRQRLTEVILSNFLTKSVQKFLIRNTYFRAEIRHFSEKQFSLKTYIVMEQNFLHDRPLSTNLISLIFNISSCPIHILFVPMSNKLLYN